MHLRLVGVGPNPSLPLFERVPFSARAHYTPEEMAKEVLNMDIGLFPMFDVENSIARGILKALIYMSGEAVAVCSPRGQVNDLIADGVNGMLANSTAEWCEKLERLIVDPALRRRIAAAGLETVREGYTLRKSFENLRLALQV
jgi:glycosyltransferase involved in cell wall biosynthesis